MTKMRLGVIDYIDSAHYLPGHGKCGRVHGHTYKIEVIIEGEVRENGMVTRLLRPEEGNQGNS